MEKPENDDQLVDAKITLPPDLPWAMHRDFLVALGMDMKPDATEPTEGVTFSTSITLRDTAASRVQSWYDELHGLLPGLLLEWYPAGALDDSADPDPDEFDEDTMAEWGEVDE